ncbi:MAG: hypothetical protein HWN66_03450 [Candidatus Helarchaeota archaeon]|nr:hypothetical protein [Candidatus Helarchaeota archaeon]
MLRYLERGFKNILGELGKRFVRRTQQKMNTLFLSIIILEYTRILVEFLYDGNLEAALEDFYDTGKNTGKSITDRHLNAARHILSKSLEDSPRMARIFWYIAMGEDVPKRKIRFVPKGTEGNEFDILTWTFDRCIFCAASTEEKDILINKETMGNQSWGAQVSGIFEALMQAVQDYVGNNYKIKVKETKCIMKGDASNEFTMWFIPREMIERGVDFESHMD